MDDDIQKAASIENKVKVHTYGYEDASRFRNHCGRSIDKPGAACHCLSTGKNGKGCRNIHFQASALLQAMTHILKICDDDTTQWSSNKRFKLMLKDRSLETVTDTLDGVKSEISKRMLLLSNRKELHSNADYKALLLSGNAELELEGDTVFVVPKDLLKLKVKSSLTRGTDHVHEVKAVEAVGKLREMLRRIGDEMFRLPSQPYDFEYKGERIMDEGKPFY
ncbi:hypothetical protein EV2_010955 [Malus domestica]